MLAARNRVCGFNHRLMTVKKPFCPFMIYYIVCDDYEIYQLQFLFFGQWSKHPFQHNIRKIFPFIMSAFNHFDRSHHFLGSISDYQRFRERMVTCRVRKKIPSVLFRFIDKMPFYRVVVHIDEIRPGLFVSLFGDASKRRLKNTSFFVTNDIEFPGIQRCIALGKGGKVFLPCRRRRIVYVVRHQA